MGGSFIVTGADADTIREGLLMAALLAGRNRAPSDAIGMSTGDQLSEQQRTDYYLLEVGRPTANPFINELSKSMALQFESGTDRVLLNRESVIAAIRDAGTVGLFETGPAPFNGQRWSGIATGTDVASQSWMRRALGQPRGRGSVVIARSEEDWIDLQLVPPEVERAERRRAQSELVMPLLSLVAAGAAAALAGWWVYSLSRTRSGRTLA